MMHSIALIIGAGLLLMSIAYFVVAYTEMPPKAREYFVDAWLVFVLTAIYFRSVFP